MHKRRSMVICAAVIAALWMGTAGAVSTSASSADSRIAVTSEDEEKSDTAGTDYEMDPACINYKQNPASTNYEWDPASSNYEEDTASSSDERNLADSNQEKTSAENRSQDGEASRQDCSSLLFGMEPNVVWEQVDRVAAETAGQAAGPYSLHAENAGAIPYIGDLGDEVRRFAEENGSILSADTDSERKGEKSGNKEGAYSEGETEEEDLLGVSAIQPASGTFQVVWASHDLADEGKNSNSLFLGGGAYIYNGTAKNIVVKVISGTDYLVYCNDLVVSDFGPATGNDEYYMGSSAEFAGLCYIYGNGAQQVRKNCVNAIYSTGNAFFDYQVTQMAVWIYLDQMDRSLFGGTGNGTKLTLNEFIQIQGKAQALADDAKKYRSSYADSKGYHDGNSIQVTPATAAASSTPNTMTLNGNYYYSSVFKVTVTSDFGEMTPANVVNDISITTNSVGAEIVDRNPTAGTFRIRIPKGKVTTAGVTVSAYYNPNLKYYRAARYTPPAGTWPSTYQRVGFLVRDGQDPTKLQVYANAKLPTSAVSVKKTSSNTTLTNQNGCYTLSGAVYTMYTDSACKNAAATQSGSSAVFKIDASGNSNTLQMSPGTYYMKETTRPKGYKQDKQVYTVVLEAGKSSTVGIKEEPMTGVFPLLIEKVDGSSGQGGPDLEGVKFRINYYKNSWAYTTDTLPAQAERSWIVRTIYRNGTCQSGLTAEYLESGSDLYAADGKLPLGTYTVQEIRESVPAGYGWNDTVFFYYIKDNNGEAAVTLPGEKKGAGTTADPIRMIIENPRPSIQTEATEQVKGGHFLDPEAEEAVIRDRISYTDFQPETSYLVKAGLYVLDENNEAVDTGITADGSFSTGKAAAGKNSVSGSYEDMQIHLDPSQYRNKRLVVFERIFYQNADGTEGACAAVHEDPQDPAQTVYVPDTEPHKTVNRISNAVGSPHTWDITAAVPIGFGKAETKAFIIEDVFDARLNYEGGLILTIDDDGPVLLEEDYLLSQPKVGAAGGKIRVEFTDKGLKKLEQAEGKTVRLKVNTSINASAEAAVHIENESGVYFETDGFSLVKMTERPYVYTGEIGVRKSDEHGNRLEGVGIQLFTEENGILQPVNRTADGRVICFGEAGYSDKDNPYICYTDKNGRVTFTGLADSSKYVLREAAALKNMELLAEPFAVTVENGKANGGKPIEIIDQESLHLKTGGSGRQGWYLCFVMILSMGIAAVLVERRQKSARYCIE